MFGSCKTHTRSVKYCILYVSVQKASVGEPPSEDVFLLLQKMYFYDPELGQVACILAFAKIVSQSQRALSSLHANAAILQRNCKS